MGNTKKYAISEINELRVLGRTSKKREPLALFWTGSGFEVLYNGTELYCEFETDFCSHEQWIAVEVNGEITARQMLLLGKQNVCLFRNPTNQKVNRIRVLKEVQAMPGDEKAALLIHSLTGDGSFQTVPEAKRKIEFIGDSITSGEGSYGNKEEQDWISSWFSTTHAYPYLTAKKLSAEYRIFSQSGYGVFCAWDGNIDNALPPFYEEVCGVLKGERNHSLGAFEKNDFSAWQPDEIIINLGTNDANAFTMPEWKDEATGRSLKMECDEKGQPVKESGALISKAVTDFLITVRKNNKNAVIIWCYGLMESRVEQQIKDGIEAFCSKTKDKKNFFLKLTQMTEQQTGARSHPGLPAHEMAAEEIAKEILRIENSEEQR